MSILLFSMCAIYIRMSKLTEGNVVFEQAWDEKKNSEVICLARDMGEISESASLT